MKLNFLTGLIILFLFGACSNNSKKQVEDERLWYRQAAEKWTQALPIGNGRLGAMVFGDVNREHIQINEESLWAGCPENPYPEDVEKHYKVFQQLNLKREFKKAYEYAMQHLAVSPTSIRSYEPFGDVFIEYNHGKISNYERSLTLTTGCAEVEYIDGGSRFKRECFAVNNPDVIAYRFTSIDGKPVDCKVEYTRKKDVVVTSKGNEIFIDGQIFDDPNGYDDNAGGSGKGGKHMKFAGLLKIDLQSGSCEAHDGSLQVRGTSGFVLYFGARTTYQLSEMNFDNKLDIRKKVYADVEQAINGDFEQIRKQQFEAHASVYSRVELSLGESEKDTVPTDVRVKRMSKGGNDPLLVRTLFQYGRYLLMASSGGQAQLPANLQGIWNEDMWAAWDADYHMNINLQMNYWPAEVCNLSETTVPLINYMALMADRGKETAKRFINSDGWMIHHASNVFGRTVPNGSTASSQVTNGYSYALSGAWMCLPLWRHYEFTQDEEYLKSKVYPIMSGAVQFVFDFLVEDEQGQLVTTPSYSPENFYYDPKSKSYLKNTVAATMDIQIITELFKVCMEAEKILGMSELTPKMKQVLARLPKVKIGEDGTIQEWIEDYKERDPGHRHVSHLFGLYPASQINRDTPKMYEAAKKTLEKRLSSGGGQTGWSRAWSVNFYARLQDGDKCLENINQHLAKLVDINLFDLHPPHIFQIDGNLGITAGVAEMLIQSHEKGKIVLLPALPKDWNKGSVKGLKARGNYVVSIDWDNGVAKHATIEAIKGGTVNVEFAGKIQSVTLAKGAKAELTF